MSTSEDNWDCPICLQCPENVYQCTNGHLICQTCILKMTTCPQCRVPFGGVKIKNLVVEGFLDEKTFPCKLKEFGCLEILKRKDLGQHIQCCIYRFRRVPLCVKIGFKCNFTANLLKPHELLQHFQQEHGILVQETQNEVTLKLNSVSEAILHSKSFWVPVILKLGNDIEAPNVLIVVCFNKSENSVWIGYNFLEDPFKQVKPSFSLTFSIQGNSSKVGNIEWTLNPSSFNFAGRIGTFIEFPIFRIPMSTLGGHYMLENNIYIIVNVTASGMNQEDQKRLRLSAPSILDLPVNNRNLRDNTWIWTCSHCKIIKPAEEKGYKCLECLAALCSDCMIQKKHSPHVLAMLLGFHQRFYLDMVILAVKDQQPLWQFLSRNADIPESRNTAEIKTFLFECQNCGSYPIMNVMYTCLLCPTRVDYCQSCVDKDIHRRHILGIILSQDQEEFITSHRKPGSALIPLIANKVNLG